MVEIGWVDTFTEVASLASHLVLPHVGHLEAVKRIFAYLRNKIDVGLFQKCDWKEFYGDVKEAVPPNMPNLLEKKLIYACLSIPVMPMTKLWGNQGLDILVYMNMASFACLLKKQVTIKTSVFRVAFVVMKYQCGDIIWNSLQIENDGLAFIRTFLHLRGQHVCYCQCTEAWVNAKKKLNSICYHSIQGADSVGECMMAHISTHENVADLAMKVSAGG